MRFIIDLLILIAILALAYWFLVRPVLIQRAALAPFFSKADMIEAGWRARLHLFFSGLKTTLFARFLILAGVLVPVLDSLMGTDLAAMLPPIPITEAWSIQPGQYVPLVVLPTIGLVTQKLRNVTTTPVGVPSVDQVAAVIPLAPLAVIEAKTEQIAVAKAPPSAASGTE